MVIRNKCYNTCFYLYGWFRIRKLFFVRHDTLRRLAMGGAYPYMDLNAKYEKLLLLMNLVICILKWVIWKTRNYIKYNKSTYREAIVITNLKKNSEVIYKWWLKTQKFETYIILGNYSYYWIHYEFSCINNFSFIVYCVKMYVLNMRDNKKDKIRKLYFDSAHNKTVQHKL